MSNAYNSARGGLLAALSFLAMLGTGCGSEPPLPTPPEVSAPAPIALEGPFVVVPRAVGAEEQQRVKEGLGQAVSALHGNGSDTFYLAIRRGELGERWFMETLLMAHFPADLLRGATKQIGMRVVSFRVQNGKLYVFDTDDRKTRSDMFDPEVLVEAYPVVTDDARFNAHPRASEYVLFDPAAGLNRFGVVDEREVSVTGRRFEVELSFAQRARVLSDGVSYEQLFTGYTNALGPAPTPDQAVERHPFRSSGTMSVAFRRYQEGEGFVPLPMPSQEYYFASPVARIPNSGGALRQYARKWNIRPGMRPIPWVLSESLPRLQQDPRFKDYDVTGAVRRGVEVWNETFGFPVFTTRPARPGESFGDQELNYIIIDPDKSYGGGAATLRSNPNTGEIRNATVYMDVNMFEWFISIYGDDTAPPAMVATPAAAPLSYRLTWNDEEASSLCNLFPPGEAYVAPALAPVSSLTGVPALTKKEKVERAIAFIIMHEVGHSLGLQHNFKGSLSFPSTSVMDYVEHQEHVYVDRPGPYDVAAIRYLYGMSSQEPTQPFCTDTHLAVDPECGQLDAKSDPLRLWYGAQYRARLASALAGQGAPPDDFTLNAVLQFVRSGKNSQTKLDAWNIATEGVRAPIPPEVLASSPAYGLVADAAARRVLQRLYLDAAPARGIFSRDPQADALLTPAILQHLRAVLLNVDGVRGPQSRRVAVDVLKKLQSYEALSILREAHAELVASLPLLTGNELMATDDLARRIDAVISPYFL
ncbi:hypothetical protein HPC49_15475 [Pyxidicoccus fallax]|uniref:EcxA zinc-binding domain-containing protein n=1 Tax=Pyxidicoccus fallax TaxID=394095 RepID=A0A848LIE8_9BACT|nr:zinc-dependent metalloprotease [Pyxidicoccus fallax]NMO17492.1 hypothetical protein [Pyxidicoccus fallax]NPC79619.1 hypothetical protein [Pyxidicoccus fallax]